MDRTQAYRGSKFTIAFARERNGRSPGAEFFDSLSLLDKAKLVNLFRLSADHASFVNSEKFGDLGGGLYEFKSFRIRMPFAYARERGLILVTHGFLKKKSKTPKEEIERAWRILKEDQERYGLRLVKDRNT